MAKCRKKRLPPEHMTEVWREEWLSFAKKRHGDFFKRYPEEVENNLVMNESIRTLAWQEDCECEDCRVEEVLGRLEGGEDGPVQIER